MSVPLLVANARNFKVLVDKPVAVHLVGREDRVEAGVKWIYPFDNNLSTKTPFDDLIHNRPQLV